MNDLNCVSQELQKDSANIYIGRYSLNGALDKYPESEEYVRPYSRTIANKNFENSIFKILNKKF